MIQPRVCPSERLRFAFGERPLNDRVGVKRGSLGVVLGAVRCALSGRPGGLLRSTSAETLPTRDVSEE